MVEDLYEEKYLPGVLKNLFSLGRLLQMRTSWFGPKLEAIKLPSWMAPTEGTTIFCSVLCPIRVHSMICLCYRFIEHRLHPRGSLLSTDSIEPLVKQIAADLALPPTAAETALTVLSGHRVRSRAQLGMLATHRTLWDSLPIVPPALKQALYMASYGAATAKPARSRWPWLVLPLVLGGVGVLVWRSPQAMAFVKRIRIER